MANRGLRAFSAAIDNLTEGLEPPTSLAGIQRAWPSVVGAVIAGVATPIGERDGVLTVSCVSAVWAQELDLMSGDLIEKLNSALGEGVVRRLRPQATGF